MSHSDYTGNNGKTLLDKKTKHPTKEVTLLEIAYQLKRIADYLGMDKR